MGQICGVTITTITGVVTVWAGVWAAWEAGATVGAGKYCHHHDGRLDTSMYRQIGAHSNIESNMVCAHIYSLNKDHGTCYALTGNDQLNVITLNKYVIYIYIYMYVYHLYI